MQELDHNNDDSISSSTNTSGSDQKTKSFIDTQARVQNHFNGLLLAYRNQVLDRITLLDHLVLLFGNNMADNYLKRIDGIPKDKILSMPKDFDLDNLLNKTVVLQQEIKNIKTKQEASSSPPIKLSGDSPSFIPSQTQQQRVPSPPQETMLPSSVKLSSNSQSFIPSKLSTSSLPFVSQQFQGSSPLYFPPQKFQELSSKLSNNSLPFFPPQQFQESSIKLSNNSSPFFPSQHFQELSSSKLSNISPPFFPQSQFQELSSSKLSNISPPFFPTPQQPILSVNSPSFIPRSQLKNPLTLNPPTVQIPQRQELLNDFMHPPPINIIDFIFFENDPKTINEKLKEVMVNYKDYLIGLKEIEAITTESKFAKKVIDIKKKCRNRLAEINVYEGSPLYNQVYELYVSLVIISHVGYRFQFRKIRYKIKETDNKNKYKEIKNAISKTGSIDLSNLRFDSQLNSQLKDHDGIPIFNLENYKSNYNNNSIYRQEPITSNIDYLFDQIHQIFLNNPLASPPTTHNLVTPNNNQSVLENDKEKQIEEGFSLKVSTLTSILTVTKNISDKNKVFIHSRPFKKNEILYTDIEKELLSISETLKKNLKDNCITIDSKITIQLYNSSNLHKFLVSPKLSCRVYRRVSEINKFKNIVIKK